MSNSIINKEDIVRDLLSNENYFQSLLEALYSNNILDIHDMQRIQLQLMDILAKTAGYYTKEESSSVREEIALKLTSSIYYTVGLFLKSQPDLKQAADIIKKEDVDYLFAQGEEILKAKIDECKALYEKVADTRLKTENQAYTDTLDYGIPLFFKQYDPRFASHETPGSIDYPLAIVEEDLTGIEYIEDYLKRLLFENKVCSLFEAEEIEALLRGYSLDSNQMLISIYKRVLTNYLAGILAGKTDKSLDITEGERDYLHSLLKNMSPEEFENSVKNAEEKILKQLITEDSVRSAEESMSQQLMIDDSVKSTEKKIFQQPGIDENELVSYISKTVNIISNEIKRHMQRDTLKNLFITLRWPGDKKIRFEDGKSLQDSAFMQMTDEIRDCSRVEDKIKIIKEEVYSIKDLMDVFTADCIFDDEFPDIFNILGDLEMALLMKNIADEVGWDNDDEENEKEWQTEFRRYFEMLGEKRRNQIITMSEEIEL